ncbi:MAG: hypothetical protein HOP08_13580 [Cyclobacteriaceae bacterium]|nr:hypothetical protein [Cyclobacteriaceae bacterium]
MKKLILPIFLILILISCEKEKIAPIPANCTEKWILVRMTGNFANQPPLVGADMDWQESLYFYPNGKFLKSRERNGAIVEAGGTFQITTISYQKYVELVYDSENELIATCEAGLKEYLMVNSDSELSGTWMACDGPGLYYEKLGFICAFNGDQ